METQTVITPKAIVEIKIIGQVGNKTPHMMIRDFVADTIGSKDLDVCFDTAFQIGMDQGTESYDMCIQLILDEVGISFEDVREHLLLQGIKL